MPRIFRLMMLLVAALLLCALPAAAADFLADVVVSAGGQQITGKMYSKGDKQRTEMNSTPAGQIINIIDFQTGKMITLIPAQKMYLEHQGLKGESLQQVRDIRAGKTPAHAKKVGSERVAGYATDVYLIKDPQAGDAKIWYAPKLKYPIKSEGQGPMGKHSMTLTNIKEGGVNGSLFQVPTGYQKFQMPKGMPGGAMPGGMGGGMPGGMGGTRGQ